MKDTEYWCRIETIRNVLFNWGRSNLRQFPWRNTGDPYKVLVAEIMLHRTKANQVEEIYEDFIAQYPDIRSIVETGPDNIKSDLYPLGLFWRADMLYELAEVIMESHSGKIPQNKEDLLKLPGIGDYIASALLCFCYDFPEPVLDTNTVRVVGRLFGLEVTDSSRRSKKFNAIMFDIVNCNDPKKISLILIDFAALVCVSGINFNHSKCPLKKICKYYNKQ